MLCMIAMKGNWSHLDARYVTVVFRFCYEALAWRRRASAGAPRSSI
jgi:hypothetical protein